MSSKNVFSNEVSVDEQTNEQFADDVVSETPEMRPSVEQDIQSKVDYSDERIVEDRLFGQTLEAEERMKAREWEIERTRVRYDRRQNSDREVRTRTTVERMNVERHYEFQKRAASVDPWCDPDRADPRKLISREELAAVNQQTRRIAQELEGWSRAAISRQVAERIVDGADVAMAVVRTVEELQTAPGQVIPIGAVKQVDRYEVDIEGDVEVLWEPSHSKIQQVGLLKDETRTIKVTVWKASRQPWMREGERVRIYGASKSWYQGRCSVALTRKSEVVFPEREGQFD